MLKLKQGLELIVETRFPPNAISAKSPILKTSIFNKNMWDGETGL
jgi:hypothetical protein